ncbi:MAG: hypothetical protein K0S74_866 [Chlamydiales bacterium]|jgi:hypothetical protein|nr:hypothetical protein [Chlamydiales bacterium]
MLKDNFKYNHSELFDNATTFVHTPELRQIKTVSLELKRRILKNCSHGDLRALIVNFGELQRVITANFDEKIDQNEITISSMQLVSQVSQLLSEMQARFNANIQASCIKTLAEYNKKRDSGKLHSLAKL